MKLYNPTPQTIIRLQIMKQGEATKYLNLCECDLAEAEQYVKNVITTQNLSPFTDGKKTTVNIRESVGGKNGKTKIVSFRGLSIQQVHDLLSKNINYKF